MRSADFHFMLPLKIKGGHATSMSDEAFHSQVGKKIHLLFNAGVLDFLDCSVRI
jgi:hypothetical protein